MTGDVSHHSIQVPGHRCNADHCGIEAGENTGTAKGLLKWISCLQRLHAEINPRGNGIVLYDIPAKGKRLAGVQTTGLGQLHACSKTADGNFFGEAPGRREFLEKPVKLRPSLSGAAEIEVQKGKKQEQRDKDRIITAQRRADVHQNRSDPADGGAKLPENL